jgi:valyl-tRNA synthetase
MLSFEEVCPPFAVIIYFNKYFFKHIQSIITMSNNKKKGYNPQETEAKILKFWDKQKIYKFDAKAKGKIYSIDTPPPYISGKMHIGHVFSYSQQDFIVRYRRMKGSVFYPFGTDDNGLPTERFIEKMNNVKSKDLGRAEFIKLCLKTLKEVTPDCIQDFKDLGISADYEVYYSTIDEHSQKVSQASFIELAKKGGAYKEDFPTIWCPECQTSIAQAELEDKEFGSLFSTLKFKVEGKELLIATTRPELLPACVAVFVHPDDKRYKSIVGKKARVPLFDYEVPIIKDKSAEIDKGTGVLMICSYGDKFDVDAVNRHKLEPKVVFNKDGTLNELAGNYKGMKIKEARKQILQDLEEVNLITEQKKIQHVVNTHDKCGCEIEFLPTKQWFIKILDKKKKLLEQGNKVKWYPKFMKKRYDNWVKGLDLDWSISRNRHFGVPIPVWECEDCNEIILANEKELPVDPLQTKKKCPKCKKQAVGEKMVLDTWATSSLTPQISAELPEVKGKVKLPFSLRPQGHDIIRTWAFYTIVKALLHENKIPWTDLVVSGNVSLGGEKMSKSKGNVIKLQDVMEEYGADALRFWAAGSKLGGDLDYQEQDLVAGKRFVNKLFNASKFVFMNLKDWKGKKPEKLEEIDKEFLIKLNNLILSTTKSFSEYEYSKVKLETEKFFWHEFADNYLEIVKDRIYNASGSKKASAQYVLYQSLLTIMKIMAPITPFITEEIYQTYFKKIEKDKSIHVADWPEPFFLEKRQASTKKNLSRDTKVYDKFAEILGKVRHEKSKAQKSMKAEINLTIDKKDKQILKPALSDLSAVTGAQEIREGKFKVEFI